MSHRLRNPAQPITSSNLKPITLNCNETNSTPIHNRDDIIMRTNTLSSRDLPIQYPNNNLIIRETEDLDYLIMPAEKMERGSLCVTELYSQSLRRRVVCALRKKQQLMLGKGDLWNIINQKWYYDKLSQNNQNKKEYIPKFIEKKKNTPKKFKLSSPSKINLLLNKMIGMQCYSESLIPIKVDISKSDRQIRVNEYIRSQQLIESIQKSKYNQLKQDIIRNETPSSSKISNALYTKRLTFMTPKPMKKTCIQFMKGLKTESKNLNTIKLNTFYDSCHKFLMQSKTERRLYTSPKTFRTFCDDSSNNNA